MTPTNSEVWDLFHTMWGDAKAQRNYTKDNWLALQAMLLQRIGERERQPNEWTYNIEGHVCGETGRKAHTVAQVLDLMKDDPDSVHSYTYDQEAAECGLDPWRLVDGIDPHKREQKADLWFDNGGSRTVELTSILYVQQPKAKK